MKLLERLPHRTVDMLDSMTDKVSPTESIRIESEIMSAIESLLLSKANTMTLTLGKKEFVYMSTIFALGLEAMKILVDDERTA